MVVSFSTPHARQLCFMRTICRFGIRDASPKSRNSYSPARFPLGLGRLAQVLRRVIEPR